MATLTASSAASAPELAKMRNEYSGTTLDEGTMGDDPVALFEQWLDEAIQAKVMEPKLMALATANLDTGMPSLRHVQLGSVDTHHHHGGSFTWFTNYHSRKGRELEQNPKAALDFWWPELERSVRIQGTVTKVSSDESNVVFNAMPISFRVGVLAMNQSEPIASRQALQDEIEHALLHDAGDLPVRPDHWGGYRLTPSTMEFWKGRASRIHDRIRYTRHFSIDAADGGAPTWVKERLQP